MKSQIRMMSCMCGILVIGLASNAMAQTPGALLEFNASNQSPSDATFGNTGSLGGSIGAAIKLHSGQPPQLNSEDGPGGNLTKSYMNVDNSGDRAAWGGSVGPFSASAITWEWWVKWDGTETTEHYMGTLLNQPSWSQYIDWHTGKQAAGGSVDHASPQANGAGYLGNLIGPIPTNEWVQLVLTVDDSTDTAQGFINGQPTAEGPRSVADPSLDDEFNWVGIGNSVYGTDSSQSSASRWQGQIALMRFYDFVLTDQQVLDNFNSVPEPATLTLLGLGILGLAVGRSRRR